MSPLHPSVIPIMNVRKLRILPPVDTRCLYLGLTLLYEDHQAAPELGLFANFGGQFVLSRHAAFARQLLYGPKDRVVRRREEARRRREFHERSLW